MIKKGIVGPVGLEPTTNPDMRRGSSNEAPKMHVLWWGFSNA